ncbi:MAG: acyltransferase family protein [Mangrovibacterium sp.]
MIKQEINPNILKSRQHFYLLDGLRGVAALAVVIFHFMEWVYPDHGENFIGHGFLAVDFFFCLSGFVIAYAYDQRLPKIGLKEFAKSRLIRLHPLVVIGTVLGLVALLIDPFTNHFQGYSALKIITITLCSLVVIPFPAMDERYFNLFGLNAPAWSLFWEYIANIVYGLFLVHAGKKLLMILTGIAAAGILYTAWSAGNLMGGWSGETFFDGGIRVAYSFMAGMLVYRNNWLIKTRIGFIPLAILLLVVFMLPVFPFDWLVEALVVLVVFPLLVSLGAGSALSGPMQRFCKFSGELSYPLYMTHYAGIWIFGNYWLKTGGDSPYLAWIIAGGVASMLVFAWLVMRFVDTPIRNYLTRKRLSHLPAK